MSNQQITPCLMFSGRAEEAMNFYLATFASGEILSIHRYGPEGPGAEGSVMHALLTLNGQRLMCLDSSVTHGFTFTPAVSFYVTFQTEAEIDQVYATLSAEGTPLMPLAPYPFSPKFAWVNDKFGVSWQLSLAQG